jgi:hypothetical protein
MPRRLRAVSYLDVATFLAHHIEDFCMRFQRRRERRCQVGSVSKQPGGCLQVARSQHGAAPQVYPVGTGFFESALALVIAQSIDGAAPSLQDRLGKRRHDARLRHVKAPEYCTAIESRKSREHDTIEYHDHLRVIVLRAFR